MPLLLVVDDDPDLLVLLKAHYNVQGYKVSVAETCEEALRLAAESRPDAVLLDFCLPKMDGARFIDILRADELTKATPVIVMSAAAAGWVASRLQKDRQVRTIEKPFEFAELDPIIAELTSSARR
jgi:DNA-binding response OmpR family regulator